MSYLLVGALLLALVFWGGRGRRLLKHPEWRVASAVAAIAVFTVAAFVGVRGGWFKGSELAVVGLVLSVMSRWPRPAPPVEPPAREPMSLEEARALLGVGSDATADEIKAAYARLMRRAHPDHGGTVGLAVQLNLARERLLKG